MLPRAGRGAARAGAALTVWRHRPALKQAGFPADVGPMASTEVGHEHAEADEGADSTWILVADDDPNILSLVTACSSAPGTRSSRHRTVWRRSAWRSSACRICSSSTCRCRAWMATRCAARSRRRPVRTPCDLPHRDAHTAARVEGLDAGAVDYIVKPFEHPELTARVRALRTKTVRTCWRRRRPPTR